MVRHALSEGQEREAKVLEAKIRAAVDHEIADLARLLVSTSEADLFGPSEFQVRDLVLRVGAQAYEQHLRGKKTATVAAPSSAPAVSRVRSFKDIVLCGRSAF